MSFARHRDSKRMSFRQRGRFAKTPSLEVAGLVKICACGQIIARSTEGEGEPLPALPEWPKACHRCGRSLPAAEASR